MVQTPAYRPLMEMFGDASSAHAVEGGTAVSVAKFGGSAVRSR
jgi:hypothetical protein